ELLQPRIGPEGLDRVEIGVRALDREEPRETTPSPPPHHQVHPRDRAGGERPQQLRVPPPTTPPRPRHRTRELPLPPVVDQQIDPDLPTAPPFGVWPQPIRPARRPCVPHRQQGRPRLPDRAEPELRARLPERRDLCRRTPHVLLREPIDRDLLDPELPAVPEQLQPRPDPGRIPGAPHQAAIVRPTTVAIRD